MILTHIKIFELIKIKRMKQVFVAGGEFEQPADFIKRVNRNIQILMDSDRNPEINDIKFTVHNGSNDKVYLAYIIAEVDMDPEKTVNETYNKPKNKKKKIKYRVYH